MFTLNPKMSTGQDEQINVIKSGQDDHFLPPKPPKVKDLGRELKCVPASQVSDSKNYVVEKGIVPSFRRQLQRKMIEKYMGRIEQEIEKHNAETMKNQ